MSSTSRAAVALLTTVLALSASGCSRRRVADYTEDEARTYVASRGYEWSPEELAHAVADDALDVVAVFLAGGIDPDALRGRAVAVAAATDELEVMRALLAAGADPNLPGGSFGQTPLATAVLRDQSAMIDLLLESGARPGARCRNGATPLHFAKNAKTARRLLDAGADAGVADYGGTTPLMGAVILGDLDLVDLLIERGADPGAADRNGRTALLYAGVYRFSRIEARLLAAGAAPQPTPRLNAEQLARYAGRYGTGEAVLQIISDRGGLLLVEQGAAGTLVASPLVPLTDSTFYRAGDPGIVVFAIRTEGDRVTGLSRSRGSGWATFSRLADPVSDAVEEAPAPAAAGDGSP